VYEVCPLAGCAVNLMYDHIRTYGGCALIVDYGHNGIYVYTLVCTHVCTGDRLTESVRAYHQHTLVDVLDAARLVADITADVNYSFLVESLKTVRAFTPARSFI
jgi:SAM-dependent MidA family methyltransferase